MPEPSIDRATFTELQHTAGADFVLELLASFLEDAPQGLAALRDAALQGDASAFRRQAHTLKTNGETFGALGFAQAARELEEQPLASLGATAVSRVDAIAELFALVAAELKEISHA